MTAGQTRRRIVDAHHHIWDLSACEYPWLQAKGVRRFFGDPTPIQKNYLVSDLRNDASDYDLAASVHVQVGVAPGCEIQETAWLQGCADAEGLPSVAIAFGELEREEFVDQIEAQTQYPILRGFRQIVGRADEEDRVTGSGQLLNSKVWQQNLAALGELGLSFDLQLTPGQVARVAEVIAMAPDTKIALCHCGSPWDQTESGLKSWRNGMSLLASLPNVFCKISGMGMFDHHWTVDSIRPIVEACVEFFGSRRCMFGSNFPVDKLYSSYSNIWRAYEEIAAPLNLQDQACLFGDSACRFYGIEADNAFAPAMSID